jgi:hypothetical protein
MGSLMGHRTTPLRVRRVLLVVLGLLVLGLAGVRAAGPVAGAPAAPPNDTFEIGITGGTAVAPGGTLSFQGTCWAAGFGAAQQASIHGYRVVGPGIAPFNFSITTNVNQSTGGISGTITVPGDASNGAYSLAVFCSTQDQNLGWGETPFTVDGPMITTTTTTSSTTTSSSPLHPTPGSGPLHPVAAEPVRTDPAFTG